LGITTWPLGETVVRSIDRLQGECRVDARLAAWLRRRQKVEKVVL
jgi:hypothetical protein